MSNGGTVVESRTDARDATDLTLELRRARFDAGAAARTLARLCVRESVDLVTLDEAVQRVRRSVGRLHEAVSALLITHK